MSYLDGVLDPVAYGHDDARPREIPHSLGEIERLYGGIPHSIAEVDRLYGREKAPSGGAIGVDHESRYEDIYLGGPDINPELHGWMKYEQYREMVLADPVVRSILWLYELPIRQGEWRHEPASENPDDRMIAAFFDDLFGLGDTTSRIDLTWDGWLQQSLKYLRWGAMFEELVWDDEPTIWMNPTAEAPDPKVVLRLARMAPRAAPSLSEIESDERTGRIARIRQDLPDQWIPGARIQPYVFEKEGGSWWGTSLLRPMWGSWRLKKAVLVASGIAYDRFAAGVPIVRYPKNQGADGEKKAREIGRTLRNHERGYVVLDGNAEEGWSVEILNGAASFVDPVPLLRHYDQQMAHAGLAMAFQLGSTETGSRAVGEVVSEPFYMAVSAIANQIREERLRYTYRQVVNVNFGTEYDVPKLTVGKIQARNVALVARAMADAVAAGMSFSDRDSQNDFRDLIGWRHLPDVVKRAVTEVEDELEAPVGLDASPTAAVEGGSVLV